MLRAAALRPLRPLGASSLRPLGASSLRPLSAATTATKQRRFPQALKTKQTGIDILHDPLWNKGMAFDYPERDRLNVRGLIPPMVKTSTTRRGASCCRCATRRCRTCRRT